MSMAADTLDRPFGAPPVRHVVVELAGEPRGKGRPRFTRSGIAYTPKETRQYETALRLAAQAAMRGAEPITGPLRVQITAAFSVPKSWHKGKQLTALADVVKPTGRPDWDNVGKVTDAFNGVVWRDDAQLVDVRVTKKYSTSPRLTVEVEQIFGAEAA